MLAVAIGGATALLLIAQAWLIATVVAGAFLEHRTPDHCGRRWSHWSS